MAPPAVHPTAQASETFQNLLSNAWKATCGCRDGRIEVDAARSDGEVVVSLPAVAFP